jgi:hypothetical protein
MGDYNCCYYSSHLFLINVLVAYYFDYLAYSLLFIALFISSIAYHTTYHIYSYIFDKICILSVVSYGGYVFFTKLLDISYTPAMWNPVNIVESLIVFVSFISIIYLFYYGNMCKKYCFCEDGLVANKYHSFLHLLSSIGHICIVII